MLQGAFTALVTPFTDGPGQEVDDQRLAQQIEFQIEGGVDGIVPTGTTGESPTLSHAEHRRVVEQSVRTAAGRIKVIAGTGSNSTSEALELTRFAKTAGADAALLVNPYYNKPSQEGLYRHFMAIADAVELPIVLYNIPGRTGITMLPQTVARLAGHENIVAIKEATGSLDIASEIASLCDSEGLSILSGDDSLTLPLMSVGGRGCISVLSNIVPQRVKALVDAGLDGDFAQARRLHLELFPLCKACLTLATNPIVIKTAMQLLGRDTGVLRLPLCEMEEGPRRQLEQLLERSGLTASV